MTEGVERFDPQITGATAEGFLPMDRTVEGDWVRYSDYEKLEERHAERMDAAAQYRRKWREAEAERDQARNQERQRIQEALPGHKEIGEITWGLDFAAAKLPPGKAADDLRERIAELNALDTLDPSGEDDRWVDEGLSHPPRENVQKVHVKGPADPSGEQGEEIRTAFGEFMATVRANPDPESDEIRSSGAALSRLRETIFPEQYVPATDTSKEERRDGC